MEKGKYADALRAVREHASNTAKDAKEPLTREHLRSALAYFRHQKEENAFELQGYAGMVAAERQVRQKMGDALWDVFQRAYFYQFLQTESRLKAALDEASSSDDGLSHGGQFDIYAGVMQKVRSGITEDGAIQKAFMGKEKLLNESLDFLLRRHRELFERAQDNIEDEEV